MDLHQASWLRADPLLRTASDAQTRLLTSRKPYSTIKIRCPSAKPQILAAFGKACCPSWILSSMTLRPTPNRSF